MHSTWATIEVRQAGRGQPPFRADIQRRWPIGSPKLKAFWRMAPGVRLIDFEIVATEVFFFECALRSLTCCFDQATRLLFLFVFLRLTAIDLIPV